MSWLRDTAARVLLRASGELMKLGLRLVRPDPVEPEAAEAEDDDEGYAVPVQNPLTPEARAMLVKPTIPRPRPEPVIEVLEGSVRERYLRRRKARGFD